MAKNKPAIAVVFAGSGEVSENEVRDLLDDFLPEDKFDEIGLVVPVSKSYFTDSVQKVLDWYDDDEHVYTVKVGDENMSRNSSKIGETPDEVEKFGDVFADKFDGFDQVVFIVAMPEDPDDPEYDRYADVVEAAIAADVEVKNLARGLDDVRLAEPDEEPSADAEPEDPKEEEDKPRRRRRRSEPEESEEKADEPEEEKPKRRSRRKAEPEAEEPEKAPEVTEDVEPSPEERIFVLEERVLRLETAILAAAATLTGSVAVTEPPALPEASEDPSEPQEAEEEAPRRGRGRPRTNFQVKEIYDEDNDDWVARPQGRLPKGTLYRTRNTKTGEITDEGEAGKR